MDRGPAYRFVTQWRVDAPVALVWPLLDDPETWPHWWHGCEGVTRLAPTGAPSPVRRYRLRWRGPLPRQLDMTVTIIDEQPRRRLAGVVSGELVGTAIWSMEGRPDHTLVGFDLAVDGARAWMRYLAPFTRPLFHWNHQRLMEQGRLGLAEQLSAATRAQR